MASAPGRVYSSNFVLMDFSSRAFLIASMFRLDIRTSQATMALLTWALAGSFHAIPRDEVVWQMTTTPALGVTAPGLGRYLASRGRLGAIKVPIPRFAPPRLHHATRGSLSALYTLCLDLHGLPSASCLPRILLTPLEYTMDLGLLRENQLHS
jgi:hypothetical protein